MPEDIDLTNKDAIAAANAETIEKQKAQDVSGKSTAAEDTLDAGSALDRLRDLAVEQKKEEAAEKTGGTPPAEEGKAPTDKAVVVEPGEGEQAKPAGDSAGTAPKPGETEGKPPTDPAAVPAKDLEAARKAEEIFKDSPSLPPNSSAKASEAFSAIKVRAAQEIAERDQKLAEAQAKLAELEAKANAPIPEEITKELESLREFRARLDVETDPKFKSFDAKADSVNEFIYAQLRRDPAITDSVIEDIKKLGGPVKVKMDKVLDALEDKTIRRVVENKMGDLETIAFEKEQAIKKAKENVKEYLASREKEYTEMATMHNTSTKKTLEDLASKVPWLNPIKPKADADEAAKKSAELHNAYAAQMRKELDLAINDDSPEMRATLLLGMVNSFRLEESYKGYKATTEAKIAELTKEVETANATIARLRSPSTHRLRESSAPTGGVPEIKPPASAQFTESASEALDRLRKEKMQAASQQ
jgi:hypothetical protein